MDILHFSDSKIDYTILQTDSRMHIHEPNRKTPQFATYTNSKKYFGQATLFLYSLLVFKRYNELCIKT
jgi:hypothetical protein